MASLKDDLCGPGVELVETHTAWVFVGPITVLKVKKPVDYGFLNFATLERRKAACEAELRLNARLAPHVYQGVLPITCDGAGKHRVNAEGPVVEYAVRMRRLPDATRADLLLGAGRLGTRELDGLAEHLAAFHDSLASTASTAAPFGSPESIRRNVTENFEQARDAVRVYLSATEGAAIERTQMDFLERHRTLFDRRVAKGRVRDGHGDLRLEHVYFESPAVPTIIDCLEFSDRFRYGDVCSDVAFLSMDLRRLGHVDLAERFIAAYARASGDYEMYELVDFYEGYRAYIRGKVTSLLAEDPDVTSDARSKARSDARNFFLLSLTEGREPSMRPTLVSVGGFIASGKTTVSEQIGELMSAPMVGADRVRKDVLGLRSTTPVHDAAFTGAYSAETSDRVYAALVKRARHVLASGRPVVLDASFRTRALREAARALARECDVAFTFIECRAPVETCKQRLVERAKSPSVSDGRLEIFDDFVAHYEAVTELPQDEHLVIDTSRPPEEILPMLLAKLPRWSENDARSRRVG